MRDRIKGFLEIKINKNNIDNGHKAVENQLYLGVSLMFCKTRPKRVLVHADIQGVNVATR